MQVLGLAAPHGGRLYAMLPADRGEPGIDLPEHPRGHMRQREVEQLAGCPRVAEGKPVGP